MLSINGNIWVSQKHTGASKTSENNISFSSLKTQTYAPETFTLVSNSFGSRYVALKGFTMESELAKFISFNPDDIPVNTVDSLPATLRSDRENIIDEFVFRFNSNYEDMNNPVVYPVMLDSIIGSDGRLFKRFKFPKKISVIKK